MKKRICAPGVVHVTWCAPIFRIAFPSIYTHSIPWALHGRRKAKRDRSLLLEGNLLDRVTQDTRDGQTNGLLIGPHASNILSEIVLTDIDRTLVASYGRYSRHIDDYEYAAKTYEEAESFIRNLSIQLRERELRINEKKTEIAGYAASDRKRLG